MDILNGIKSLFSVNKKSIPLSQAVLSFLRGDSADTWKKKGFKQLSADGYESCSTVYACVDRICKCIRPIEILLYDMKNRKEPKEVENHEALNLIRKPNEKTSWQNFINTIAAQLLIGGNCYLLKIEANSRIKELWTLRPDTIRINEKGNYEYESVAGKITYTPEQIVHIKTFHPTDDREGLAQTGVAGISIDENMEGKRWTAAVMKNSGVPSGVLKSIEPLDTITFNSLEKKLEDKTIGSRKGRPLILEGGLEWQQVSISPRDMEWMNSRKFSTVEICSIYGVPPELIGYPEFRTYNNVAEAKQELYIQTALPLLDFILEQLNVHIISKYYGLNELWYDQDSIQALRTNVDQLWTRVMSAKREGLLSLNEARLVIGYKTVKYGNVIYDSMGRVPVATDDDAPIVTYDDLMMEEEQDEPKKPKPEEGTDPEDEGDGDDVS